MVCPYCGWKAVEVNIKTKNGNDIVGAYTCENATCEMCSIVFSIHILGTLREVNGTVSNGNGFEKGEQQ